MDVQSSRFYNQILLEKFIANLDFLPLSDDVTSPEYKTYFTLFSRETARLKAYLVELIKDPKWSTHPEQGLSEFDPQYFQFAFEYHTGLKLNSAKDFHQSKNGLKTSRSSNGRSKSTCNRLLINDEDKQKSIYDKMILVGQDQSQRWSSKQE